MVAEGGRTDAERIAYGFRRCLGRKPQPDEVQELTGLLEREKKRLAEGWVSVPDLAMGTGRLARKPPKGSTPTEVGAYTIVSRVLLNLDETITKE